jgi:glycosyltransferase involved in cell wall biosynthesis
VEVLCGTVVDAVSALNPVDALGEVDSDCQSTATLSGESWLIASNGVQRVDPPLVRGIAAGVPISVLHRAIRKNTPSDSVESTEFLSCFEVYLRQFKPSVLVTYGGDIITQEILSRARKRGIATVFTLHNFGYNDDLYFSNVDEILVASSFSATYYKKSLNVNCAVISNIVDWQRVKVDRSEPRYLTFVNPSREKGVFCFVRIADELGRRRPDIPILVVESRGTEETLVNCGIDLRTYGNVFLMVQTPDPRMFWSVTKLCIMPSLFWENQPLTAIEAMINGIPVIGSDRGGIPETLGQAGVVLPLPDRLTPTTRILPSSEEVQPWVEAIIRLWDDPEWYEEHRLSALAEAKRWSPEELEPRYVEFFRNLRPGRGFNSSGSST